MKKPLALATLALTATLALSACGGDEDSKAPAAKASSSPSATATPTPSPSASPSEEPTASGEPSSSASPSATSSAKPVKPKEPNSKPKPTVKAVDGKAFTNPAGSYRTPKGWEVRESASGESTVVVGYNKSNPSHTLNVIYATVEAKPQMEESAIRKDLEAAGFTDLKVKTNTGILDPNDVLVTSSGTVQDSKLYMYQVGAEKSGKFVFLSFTGATAAQAEDLAQSVLATWKWK